MLDFQILVVRIRIHSEVFLACNLSELFDQFFCCLDGERLAIRVDAVVLNDFVELSVSEDYVDV